MDKEDLLFWLGEQVAGIEEEARNETFHNLFLMGMMYQTKALQEKIFSGDFDKED